MTGTDTRWPRAGRALEALTTPSLAEGRSRVLLLAGMATFALGTLVSVAPAVGVGVGIVVLAFLYNTVGKLVHYRNAPLDTRGTLLLAGSWLLLATTASGAVVSYTWARYGAGDGEYFWPVAVAGFGFGLLHMAAQARLLEVEAPEA